VGQGWTISSYQLPSMITTNTFCLTVTDHYWPSLEETTEFVAQKRESETGGQERATHSYQLPTVKTTVNFSLIVADLCWPSRVDNRITRPDNL
jgi:hypothetical protein